MRTALLPVILQGKEWGWVSMKWWGSPWVRVFEWKTRKGRG